MGREEKNEKIILTMALLGAISASNAMMVAGGVELVSNQSWTTGNVIDAHMEDSNIFFSHASASAIANGGSGKIFTNITSTGNHSFQVSNISKNTQTYIATVRLCANDNDCFDNARTYRLNSGSNYSSSATTYVTSYYSSIGCKPLVASTIVSGDTSATDVEHASVCISK